MANRKVKIGVIVGYVFMAILALGIAGMSLSVLAKPYNSAHNTSKAIIEAATDTTKTVIVSDKAKEALPQTNMVDTVAINTAFLQKMHEKGELLSSDEFASRITDYYNTLVAVLTALFVLFTVVTYITIRSKFDSKFEDKARDLEDKQRQKIVDELRNMLSDSKRIEEVIISAVGGDVEDKIVTQEEMEELSSIVGNCGNNIKTLMTDLADVKKKQSELYGVVSDIQEQVAKSASVVNTSSTPSAEETTDKVENPGENAPVEGSKPETESPSKA